ncbi:MAG TPA: YidC/Oxa1 family insertase periplasmic-domain containing protein [Candidatus Omnitrophota bacterium]|nr:YidC/Oxa1 family insertase periplasmic-domain containing protein [Candidatus Omnitrophota bacterium]HPT07185.1 YidC/Oxa1 family insertase periplasmic-domain containing protein [Candidatus Omnitrophota bacterium]
MEKRILVAIALSLIILTAWSVISPKQKIPASGVTTIVREQPKSVVEKAVEVKDEKPTTKISLDIYSFQVIDNEGIIKSVFFNKYNDELKLLKGFLLKNNFDGEGSATSVGNTIVYKNKEQKVEITKKLELNNNFGGTLVITLKNMSNLAIKTKIPLVLGVLNFEDPINGQFSDVTVGTKEKTVHWNGKSNQSNSAATFIALRNRYFAAIIEPKSENFTGYVQKIDNKYSEVGITSAEITLAPNEERAETFSIYLGPLDLKYIYPLNSAWGGVVNFGTFDIISHTLLKLLDMLHGVFHSWGLAIIILSILVYLILYPLTLKQMRAMKQMQALQPRIEELRKLHKDNPQKLNKEMMELYREHKVNPLGGCLPIVLQIPIFFALYQALMRAVDLKGSGFLWIKDLAMPDRLFVLPFNVPGLGNEFNILPILMAIGMFVQQKMSMVAASKEAAEQQKIMMIIFPILFGFIFYKMPSGLVLYWFVNSGLMLASQIMTARQKV